MGKKKLKEIASFDLVSSSLEVYDDQKPKHHSSCCHHIAAVCQALPDRITKKKAREIKSFELAFPFFSGTIPRRERSKRILIKNSISKQHRKLDSNVFESFLEKLWSSFSEDKKASFTYLDCLWFALYRKWSTKAKVLTWIKSKHIFSRKYVFVPIICWHHWSLLIFCHFGESLQSKTRTPCMLLLDSLEMANPKRLEPDIRKFVLDIYREEGRPEKKESIAKIPFLVPKVPQQKNSEDCGIFVLYFMNLFLESAPEDFNICGGYPYFMNENWFSSEGLERFCKKFCMFCRKIKPWTQ